MADVFALPVIDGWFGLETEGLGIVLLEAQACETPIVSGRSGGTVEALRDGHTGFLINAQDQAQLVDRVVYLLTHDAERKKIGQAGRNFVTQDFMHELPPQQLLDWLAS